MRRFFVYLMMFSVLLTNVLGAWGFRFSPNPNRAAEIKWRKWGKEAFKEASRSKKPVLLSISAVWCHWCHVMDETTYSDRRVIEFINRYFVAVRVDSDMRPDIDAIYNQGGWPSTVFLSPEGFILDGGTYIPPDEMLLRLKRAVERYRKGEYNNIQTKEENTVAEPPVKDVSISSVNGIKEMLLSFYDSKYGGFGGYQKFPNPSAIDFLLDYSITVRMDKKVDSAVKTTLDGMADGEIHDRVEGGFFRYATRRDWSAPHYEKMLETNGNMLSNYARAFRRYGGKKYREMLYDIFRYIKENLTGANGEFYGSQDADESYYKNSNRDISKKPTVDKTVYTDRASVMIKGLLDAYNATLDEEYLSIATKGVEFLVDKLYHPEVGVYHFYRDDKAHVAGLLRDNALLGLSLISFYSVTGREEYLEVAQQLEKIIYRDYLKDGKLLITLNTSVMSQVSKGPFYRYNERMILYETLYFLKKLYYLQQEKWKDSILKDLTNMYLQDYDRYPVYSGLLGRALLWDILGPIEIKIVYKEGTLRDYLSVINRLDYPLISIRGLEIKKDGELIKREGLSLKPAVYICRGKTCARPVTEPVEVLKTIKQFIH